MFVLACLCSAIGQPTPLPADGAELIARTVLKSEDGKHEVQLATFRFPISKEDGKLLTAIMNSDGYLHHFRPRPVYLTVGEKSYVGGPRLTEWHGIVLPGQQKHDGWTASFVLPADVNLVGKVQFRYSDNDKPAKDAFAKLELTDAAVKGATVSFRATVTATGKRIRVYSKTGAVEDAEAPFVAFVLNHTPHFADMTIGDAKPAGATETFFDEQLKQYRQLGTYESVLTFKDAPPAGAAVRVKFKDYEGWYKAEMVPAKKEK